MVITEVTAEASKQMEFAENNDVVQAVSADRANGTFYEWVLPRRSRCNDHLVET